MAINTLPGVTSRLSTANPVTSVDGSTPYGLPLVASSISRMVRYVLMAEGYRVKGSPLHPTPVYLAIWHDFL